MDVCVYVLLTMYAPGLCTGCTLRGQDPSPTAVCISEAQ